MQQTQEIMERLEQILETLEALNNHVAYVERLLQRKSTGTPKEKVDKWAMTLQTE